MNKFADSLKSHFLSLAADASFGSALGGTNIIRGSKWISYNRHEKIHLVEVF